MLDNIVNEKEVTFKELEKSIFEETCILAQRATADILEKMDDIILRDTDTRVYRNKGPRKTTIKTVYGEVTYSRRVYQTKDEEGRNVYVYLLDEAIGMNKIGMISTNLAEKIVSAAVESSFRVASGIITDTTGQPVSHSAAWNLVQAVGEKLNEEESAAVESLNAGKPKGEKEIQILFEEMDGLWIGMQGENAGKAPKQEVKIATMYEGWKDEAGSASHLAGKTVFAGIEPADVFHSKREAQICSIYNTDEIKLRVLNGDGGKWIDDKSDAEVVRQLDRFHVIKEIRKAVKDSDSINDILGFLNEGRIEDLLEYVQIYADSVVGTDSDGRAETDVLALKKYLENHRDELTHYDQRGIDIPEAPEGMVFRHMGVQENQNATVISMRMKHGRRRWKTVSGNNMAKVLYYHENRKLIEAIDRYTDGYVKAEIAEPVFNEVLSAAKAPKKDGKGSKYADIFYSHLPLLDSKTSYTAQALRNLSI